MASPLKVGDIVHRTGIFRSKTHGRITGFEKQGDVEMALVEWEGDKTLPNPKSELVESLVRVGSSEGK